MIKNNLPSLVIIFLLSALAAVPLLVPGLHQIHDDQQIARLFLFDQALKAGQFPLRWVDGLGFGFGYPIFVFYPPLVYIVGELFHLIGFGFIDAIKLTFFTSIFLSGIAMYIFAKDVWGKSPAVVAAAFYIFVPYRALDIYVRGALAEAFSFVWLPLILWSFYKLIETEKPKYDFISLRERVSIASELKLSETRRTIYIYLSAIFLALLMITHNLIFLPFMLLLAPYLLFLIYKSNDRKKLIVSFKLSVLLAFALSAFFWIPALFEKKFTIVDDLLLVNLANYKIHFVYLQQLWNWNWGFGGSAEGLADGISFRIGKLNILLALSSILLAALTSARNKLNSKLTITFAFLFALSAFMTTSYSKPIWDLITPLQYLQFPWRYLTFTALFSSILAGSFIYYLKLPVLKLIAALSVVVVLVSLNLKLFKPQSYRDNLTDEIATSNETINWDISMSSFEYSPKGVAIKESSLGTNVIDVSEEDIPISKVNSTNNIAISNIVQKPHKLTFTADANEPSMLTVNTYNFPGWTAKIDGQQTIILSNNKFKLITLNLPKGVHDVKIEFKDTAVRKTANVISFVSIIIITLFLAKAWRKTF